MSQPLSRIIVYKCVTDIETSWFVSLIAAKFSQKSWNYDDSNNDDDFSFAVYVLSRQALIVIFSFSMQFHENKYAVNNAQLYVETNYKFCGGGGSGV